MDPPEGVDDDFIRHVVKIKKNGTDGTMYIKMDFDQEGAVGFVSGEMVMTSQYNRIAVYSDQCTI